MSSAPTSLPLMSTNLTPSTSPISVSLKLANLSITPSASSGYNLVTSPSSNSTQALSPSSTSLESTSLDPTFIITSPFNVQSSAPILYTSELLEPLCTTPTPVLSTHLYLSKLTLNLDRPTVPTALYLPS
ncbi:unnamed protein product [Macrosiphum euphorbiae]|uniref:Uncharacterized protein n=1 Tax=Macrosiphum euphorbiae TaxID=13131 RepID=A0AAV0W2S6_9HEMI|nr:unnamed protein product [Macrosiphum euphorbiae]